ncbi:unnamed protein product [Caenorhabditis brenneri]
MESIKSEGQALSSTVVANSDEHAIPTKKTLVHLIPVMEIANTSSPNATPTMNTRVHLIICGDHECDKKLTDNQSKSVIVSQQKPNASVAPTVPSQLSSKRSTCLDTALSVFPRNADLASFKLTNQRNNIIVSRKLLSESSTRRYSTLEKSLINADLASFDHILNSQFQLGSTKPVDQASSSVVQNSHVQRKRASTEGSAFPAKKKSGSSVHNIDVSNCSSPTSKANQPYSEPSGVIDDTIQRSIANSNE